MNLVYLCESMGLQEVADYWEQVGRSAHAHNFARIKPPSYRWQVIKINDYQKQRFAKLIVRSMFNTVNQKKLAMFGFAFKKVPQHCGVSPQPSSQCCQDTGDTRETAAAYVVDFLLEERAVIEVYDPKVKSKDMFVELDYTCGVNEESKPRLKVRRAFNPGSISWCSRNHFAEQDSLKMVSNPYEAAKGAHAIIIMTEWDEFKTYDYQRLFDSMEKPAFLFDGRNILPHSKLREIGFEVHAIGKPGSETLMGHIR